MSTIGLTGVLAALSLATDLGSGFAPEKGVRSALAAVAIGQHVGMDDGELADVFQGALLQSLGCTSYATENALHFGDDLAFQRGVHTLDVTDPASLASFGSWAGVERGAQLRAHFLAIAPTVGPQATQASCEASRTLGLRLGLRPNAIAALDHIHERWDGLGIPGTHRGASLPLTARVMHVAEQSVIAHAIGGGRSAVAALEQRAGGHLDPEVVALVLADPDALLAALAAVDPMAAAIEAEPPPRARLAAEGLDGLAEVFGDVADLKCRFTLGHSRGVARLVDRAAALSGLTDDARGRLRRAALVHDVGRTSVSTGIWERAGALSPGESDQVRLHAYWSERVLARSVVLGDVAGWAGSHHERLDGSGPHRGSGSASLPRESRILAAADVMHALREDRPHRAAHDLESATRLLTAEAGAGRLDPEAVAAVIEASGAPRQRRVWPAGRPHRSRGRRRAPRGARIVE